MNDWTFVRGLSDARWRSVESSKNVFGAVADGFYSLSVDEAFRAEGSADNLGSSRDIAFPIFIAPY